MTSLKTSWRICLVVLAAACAAAASDGWAASPNAAAPAWAFPSSSQPVSSTDTVKNKTLPGSVETFSKAQLLDRTTAVDWFPNQHPAMPPAVKGGRSAVFACGFCHLPTGVGRTENADLAGMPVAYLQQQIRDMKSGARKLIDPRFAPDDHMLETIRQTSDADADAAARYFAALPYSKHLKVVETDTIPRVHEDGFIYVFAADGAKEPLGERIVEGPDSFDRFEMRDPRVIFTAYVPVGSIARGAALANGQGGAKQACTICHGVGLKGGPVGLGPPIAGRYPTEIFRQLYAIQIGTRNGVSAATMKPIVAPLSQSQMIDLAAYVGSLDP